MYAHNYRAMIDQWDTEFEIEDYIGVLFPGPVRNSNLIPHEFVWGVSQYFAGIFEVSEPSYPLLLPVQKQEGVVITCAEQALH
jgi:hypothetical protein